MTAAGRRGDVLSVLRTADAALSVTQIADRLAVHPNTVRFHLDTLLANGQVRRVPTGSRRRGRPAQLFAAVPGMDPAGPRHYRLLAEMLVAAVAAEPDAPARGAATGRAWGERLAAAAPADRGGPPVQRLVGLLDEVGFAPRHHPDTAEIGLHNCPFLELAQTHAEVVCPLHLGLMQGALTAWDATVDIDVLTPFAQPDRCVAHLVSKGAQI
ncbi:helix-turn-helix transcriptional regulator [Mycolicibacterium thermoresistibile]